MRAARAKAATLARDAWVKTLILMTGALLIALFITAAQAATTPSQFVQTAVDEGVSILSDKSSPDRTERFRSFMLKLVEERRIALFTLGTYRKQASEADVNTFVDAFTDYAIAVYESRLTQYSGQSLKVTEVTERSATDYIVTTVVQGDTGGNPIQVGFRLNKTGEEFSVVDIQVVGIWLAIDQQGQFSSFLKSNDGSVAALSDHLRKQTEKIRAGQATQ